jgi:hypothetical protein
MLLSKLVLLKESVDKSREEMHKLAESKGLSHPEVINISRELDNKIIILQQFIMATKSKHTKFEDYL